VLRAVRVERQNNGTTHPQDEVLVLEGRVVAEGAAAPGAVAVPDVAALAVAVVDDAVELGALVVERHLVLLALAALA
jgi:hypothetical protein